MFVVALAIVVVAAAVDIYECSREFVYGDLHRIKMKPHNKRLNNELRKQEIGVRCDRHISTKH